MKIIKNNKLDLQFIQNGITKPALYEKSTDRFWDDPHISQEMLKLHLNPDIEAASRTKAVIEAEAAFIIRTAKMDQTKSVVDLGCGPGLYVREFAKTGANVTGIDLSQRSVDYASSHIGPAYTNTQFIQMNYLDMAYTEAFDAATLIYYDFCVLSVQEQNALLKKIHAALKPGGLFLFDVVSEKMEAPIATSVTVCENGGFWSPRPYMEILSTYLYGEPKTEGRQYVIIEEDGTAKIIRLYHRMFYLSEITEMLHENGFEAAGVYNNLQGEPLTEDSKTYGIVAVKA